MLVPLNFAPHSRQFKCNYDPIHGFGPLQHGICVDREEIRWLVIHYTAAWAVLVLVTGDGSGQSILGKTGGASPTPCLPDFIVSSRMGKEFSVGLCFRKGGGIGVARLFATAF